MQLPFDNCPLTFLNDPRITITAKLPGLRGTSKPAYGPAIISLQG